VDTYAYFTEENIHGSDVLEKLEREMAHSRFLKLKSERWDGQSSWVAQKTENFEN
jgi:hypothetical protein